MRPRLPGPTWSVLQVTNGVDPQSLPEFGGSENNYGMNVYGSVPLGPKWNVRSNLSVFDRYITTGSLGGNATTGGNGVVILGNGVGVSSWA